MSHQNDPARLAADLSRALEGPVLRPEDPGAAEESAGFQLGLRHRPDLVAGARNAADVRATLRLAGTYGVPVTVHNTGHGMRAAADGGVLLTLRRLDAVTVDPATATAQVAGGATWDQVITAAAPHGLVPPSGSLGGVGAVGYTFGGGIGLLGRADGWAADHVRAFTVVTGDGDREVGPDDPEDFARLRGSGPAPGEVVTRMTVGLLPEGPLQGGGLAFDIGPSDADGDPEVPHAFHRWTADLPRALTATLRVMAFPQLDQLPPHLKGRRIARVAVALRGTPELADQLLAPLRELGNPIEDSVAPMRFGAYARVHAEPDDAGAFIGENLLVDALTPQGLDSLARLTGPMVITNIRHLGGALADPPAVPDTVMGRDARYLVATVSEVEPELPGPAPEPAAAHDQFGPARVLEPFAAARVGVSRSFSVGPRPRTSPTPQEQA
ncbi:FAD-binding oxidoreductase [Streptomyces boluensis]|uniref:FAD-binding protein n=1 Tax=Streptomyces boluensis TaxID=1775135 RepID=A0A964XJA5_9ACTN|nr:FAD-dependent oxidoreductase [Streptomyces boluensis]NBE50935.1 FAD-binding protein [Streptomyces boluensis]